MLIKIYLQTTYRYKKRLYSTYLHPPVISDNSDRAFCAQNTDNYTPPPLTNDSLKKLEITKDDVKKSMNTLKHRKASSTDKISNAFLQILYSGEEFVNKLASLFNTIFVFKKEMKLSYLPKYLTRYNAIFVKKFRFRST